MPETAIAYSDSGVGKTTICISLSKWMYQTYGLTTRLISSEGWEPVENESLTKTPTNFNGIVEAFNVSTRPKLLADMRKLMRGWWPKVVQEDIQQSDGSWKRTNVRRIIEDKEALGKVGLYFIETLDGIADRFMAHIIKEETMEMDGGKLKVKSIGPQGSSGRYEEDGEIFGSNSQGHYNIVQTELYNLVTASNGIGGGVKMVFWTSHVGTGTLKGETCFCPLLVGEARNAKVPSWFGECFHLEETPRIMDENGNQLQDKVVRAFYESHRETGLMEGPRFLCKSRVGLSDVEALHEKFSGGFIPLGTKEGEGLDQYYRWLKERKGGNVKNMKEWKEKVDNGRI